MPFPAEIIPGLCLFTVHPGRPLGDGLPACGAERGENSGGTALLGTTFLFLADRVPASVESGLMRTEIAPVFVLGPDQEACREVAGALELP